ncbi:hypothetical protein K461DRAFT_298056 [Myriangium duriaei CBS 260.36]|uniref:Uncharacterized protein n=1 Tax=Myriangium duriaei CBS 260.36 TaxID=1168546 RepID=A0A9P4MBT6_9PEZI|nr:hypothetical protein K461DRAFT_298056 [Myriangium duriaei CBS 260.36]
MSCTSKAAVTTGKVPATPLPDWSMIKNAATIEALKAYENTVRDWIGYYTEQMLDLPRAATYNLLRETCYQQKNLCQGLIRECSSRKQELEALEAEAKKKN